MSKSLKEVEENIPVKFEVDKILFRDDLSGKTIFKAKFKEINPKNLPTSEFILRGDFVSIFKEDEFEGSGTWVNEERGFVFNLNEDKKRIVPQSKKGIVKFLKRFVKGIGTSTSQKIVDYFGETTLSRIEKNWLCLLEIPGMGEKKARKIYDELKKHKRYEAVAMFVLSNGGGYRTAIRIYESLGEDAVFKIKDNPYCLSTIPKVGFLVADQFAKNSGLPFNHPDRIKYGILYFIEATMQGRGDLFVYKKYLVKELQNFLLRRGAFKETRTVITLAEINKALKELVEDKSIVIEQDSEMGDLLYLRFYHFVENQIIFYLKKLLQEEKAPFCSHKEVQTFIERFDETNAFPLAEKQKEAIYMALSNGMSILTGGPGTGKTQTINAIIQCIKSIRPDAIIELSAPTGKASKRMTELTGMPAKTIHRLIKLNGFEESHQTQTIECDFLVVDESSMVDAYVFYKLLSSIGEDTRILFVGDYEQLPSVGAGLILRDLINSTRIPTTTLTEIFRQAKESQIVMNSHKIIEGKRTIDNDGLTFDQSKQDFYFIEKVERHHIIRAILDSVQRLITNQGYSLNDIQVISPMKKGDLGVDELNRLMQEKFNPSASDKRELRVRDTEFFRVGDRVMQTINNYHLEVFNGETGKVLSITGMGADTVLTVDFGDKTVEYDYDSAEQLSLSFAISSHKSQGSEFPIVIMPIHSSHEIMLNKNLIYTTWTRAREKVILVGSKKTLDKVIEKNDNTIRNSRIKEKIMRDIKPRKLHVA